MGKIKLLNSSENGYFVNNQIDIADSVPTSGTYKIGDIIIKSTQVAGEAIGWICVQAGTPGVWSEFGGMLTDERELIINPESIGMDELSRDIKTKLLLTDSLKNSISQIQNKIVTLESDFDEKLSNIDFSDYVTKNELNSVQKHKLTDDNGKCQCITGQDLNNIKTVGYYYGENMTNAPATNWYYVEVFVRDDDNVYQRLTQHNITMTKYERRYKSGSWTTWKSISTGDLNELQTENKTTLVEAINEVFQSGVNVKQNLVDTLIAKGVECSTSNTFDELISFIADLTSNVFKYWSVAADDWFATGKCTAMPATSYHLTATAYKTKIYCIGGSGTTTANRVFDVKTNSWATLTAMPTGRYGLDATRIGKGIYCIGGYNNLTTNQRYDIDNNSWSTLATMPTGREFLTVDAVSNNIYAIGGSGSTTYLATNEVYDVTTDTWSTKTVMPVAKYDHSSAVIGTDIYCIGGYTGSLVKTNYKYDTLTDTWTTKTAVTSGRRRAACEAWNGKIYYSYGSNASTTYYKNLYCYNPSTDTWTTLTAGPSGTGNAWGRSAAIVDGLMFVFGGYGGSALSYVDCYVI